MPHTGTLSHYRSVPHIIPFCEPALMHFLLPTSVDPPPLQLASLRQDAAREGSDAGNIIAGHQQLLSAEKHAVGCCQGGGAECGSKCYCHWKCCVIEAVLKVIMDDLLNSCFFCSFEHKEHFL